MDKNSRLILILGVVLQIAYIIGYSISSLNNHNTLINLFLIPNILSYIFILLGLILMYFSKNNR